MLCQDKAQKAQRVFKSYWIKALYWQRILSIIAIILLIKIIAIIIIYDGSVSECMYALQVQVIILIMVSILIYNRMFIHNK